MQKYLNYYCAVYINPEQVEMILDAIVEANLKSKIKSLHIHLGWCQYFRPIPEHTMISNMLKEHFMDKELKNLSLTF